MAELIPWSDRYNIGNKTVDEQHKHLVRLINVLHEAKEQGRSGEQVDKVLHELSQYADTHFDAEEKILEKAFFPKLDAHKMEHGEFRTWLANSKKKYAEGRQKRELPNEVINYLKSWLISHIMNSDKKNAYYLCKGDK